MAIHFKGTRREILALSTFVKLTRCVLALNSRLAERGTIGSLTASQFGVMEALYHLGPMGPTEICSKLLTSNANMTVVLDNLEKRNLLLRERVAGDRRALRVVLTPEGNALIQQLLPAHIAAITDELSVLTPEEQEELGVLCRKLGKKQAQPTPSGRAVA